MFNVDPNSKSNPSVYRLYVLPTARKVLD